MSLSIRSIGPFKIEKELGSGAMGTVYQAVYEDGRVFALKVISLGLSGNETAMARFEREAKILKQLKHPNIVRLFATGRTQGTPYFAMEFVNGEPLDQVLARRVRFSWEQVVDIGRQVCAALQHAHEKGIIHRDLKPANIMRLEDGTIKLTDFGIAKDIDVTALTGANATVGTAAYMSPEQCKGETITTKSDLYSLGVVMYELLTGRKPFTAESTVEMFMKHVNEPPPRPNWVLKGSSSGEIPTWLETVVLQLMEKKPEHRPLNAETVGRALDEGMEKFYSGQSAAVAAVRARAGDRRIQTNVIDETDREAARTLRGAILKKRIRKKSAPIYTRVWFLAPLLVLFLAGFGGILYLATRPPAPETLYRKAERLMSSPDTYMEALYRLNESDGPVREFLRRYPDHELAPKVREWKDLAETTDLLNRLRHNSSAPRVRKNYLPWEKVDPNYEAQAFEAIRYEDYGDLLYAVDRWNKARGLASQDPEQRVALRLAELRLEKLVAEWSAQKDKEPDAFRNDRAYRTTLLTRKLDEGKTLKADSKMNDLQKLAEDTIRLYKDDDDADVRKLADEIHGLFFKKKPDEGSKSP